MGLQRLGLFALAVALLSSCGAPARAPTADNPAALPWEQVLEQARGGTVDLFMWGGDANINSYLTTFAAPRLKERYDITLVQTPLGDTAEAVTKVLGEKTAGKTSGGSIDLVWLNGENFRTMRQGELLYGPWAQQVPSSALIPWHEPAVANDFGEPVEGYELPWGRAQFVMIYDSAVLPEPPRSFAALLEWAEAHPGRMTYPAPPDYTGSVFVRHAMYELAGGYEPLLGPFDQQVYDEEAGALWAYLNELAPSLWRGGETYPQSVEQLHTLFASGEVDLTMSYNPVFADGAIARGQFAPTTRSYLFDGGTIANTHYLAIPFNAADKAAAMVAADFLASPEAQIAKARPEVWGDLPVLDLAKLSPADRAALEAVPRGAATLPPESLAAGALPEPSSAWIERIERDWQQHVLRR